VKDYLIIPPQKVEWKLDTNFLLSNLRTQWPGTELWFHDSSFCALCSWEVKIEDARLECNLDRSQQGIFLQSDLEACVEFAIWYRKTVPNDIPLIFCDAGLYNQVELEEDTTEQDIIKVFS
jgi:hypothetical protein